MKKESFLGLGGLLLLLSLLVCASPARAEMYVEAYLGGVQGANFNEAFNESQGVFQIKVMPPGKTDPQVMGGLKLGTWFVKEGFLGFNYPDWMKYFGFYTDFSFHRLNMRKAPTVGTISGPGIVPFNISGKFQAEGYAATWAFMFAARYGFLQDSEVPFGRLQPYVAVGPAILFTGWNPQSSYGWGNDSAVAICLAVETGVRWMCLKNVSIDVSFKYRFAQPNFDFSADGGKITATYEPTYHLFSGQVGAAYHF